jgi:type II secretory pathway pseudopilin PulG
MLFGLIVAIFLILLALSVAAPIMARDLRREREVEAVHRGNQYVQAIRRYYFKFGRYPGSIDQLVQTNNVRYLRQKYVDPITGKDDWRLIPLGQNKTTVKGFFGQPLAGIASTGLGSVAGMVSPGMGMGATPGIGGAAGPGGVGANATSTGGIGAGGAPGAIGSTDTSGSFGAGAPGSTGSSGSTGGTGSGSGAGSTGPFMGVGLSAAGDSIVELNEQKTYDTWEFLYDPRIEQLKAKAGLNAGAGSVGAGSLGQTPGSSPTSPGAPGGPGAPGTPGTPPPNQP